MTVLVQRFERLNDNNRQDVRVHLPHGERAAAPVQRGLLSRGRRSEGLLVRASPHQRRVRGRTGQFLITLSLNW